MASCIGKGVLSPYSCELALDHPILVSELPKHMKLPELYHHAVIAVRQGRILPLEAFIHNNDEILIFVAPMGG